MAVRYTEEHFLRGKHDPGLLRGSIVTPSLEAAIMNGKYANALPLYRIEQELARNDISISRQTMANWTIACAERYLAPLYEVLKAELIKYHVHQADETTVQVLHLSDEKGKSRAEVNYSKCYMWVHRSREFYKERQIVLYQFRLGGIAPGHATRSVFFCVPVASAGGFKLRRVFVSHDYVKLL